MAMEPEYDKTWKRLTPLGKPATTDDIANSALFLLSEQSGQMTGQTWLWTVDGVLFRQHREKIISKTLKKPNSAFFPLLLQITLFTIRGLLSYLWLYRTF
jgi:hypothetical protein